MKSVFKLYLPRTLPLQTCFAPLLILLCYISWVFKVPDFSAFAIIGTLSVILAKSCNGQRAHLLPSYLDIHKKVFTIFYITGLLLFWFSLNLLNILQGKEGLAILAFSLICFQGVSPNVLSALSHSVWFSICLRLEFYISSMNNILCAILGIAFFYMCINSLDRREKKEWNLPQKLNVKFRSLFLTTELIENTALTNSYFSKMNRWRFSMQNTQIFRIGMIVILCALSLATFVSLYMGFYSKFYHSVYPCTSIALILFPLFTFNSDLNARLKTLNYDLIMFPVSKRSVLKQSGQLLYYRFLCRCIPAVLWFSLPIHGPLVTWSELSLDNSIQFKIIFSFCCLLLLISSTQLLFKSIETPLRGFLLFIITGIIISVLPFLEYLSTGKFFIEYTLTTIFIWGGSLSLSAFFIYLSWVLFNNAEHLGIEPKE